MMGKVIFSSALIQSEKGYKPIFEQERKIASKLKDLKQKRKLSGDSDPVVKTLEELVIGVKSILALHKPAISDPTITNFENEKSRGKKIRFQKPLTKMEMLRPINDALPNPCELQIEIVLEINIDNLLEYSVKLITRHEMFLEYSDVFSRQLGLMIGEGYGLVYDFMTVADRRYVGIKAQGDFRSGDYVLQRLLLCLDRLITISLMFDVEPKGLYTQNNEPDSLPYELMIRHYGDILDKLGHIMFKMYDG
jgi:hypothetical protein